MRPFPAACTRETAARREKILAMMTRMWRRVACGVLGIALCGSTVARSQPAQPPDSAAVIRGIDAAVEARVDNVLEFTDIEHYAVFRGKDQTHPVAEMTVKDSYRKGIGKTYTLLSQSGSGIIFRFGLKPLLDDERILNEPGNVSRSWFNSANYRITPKLGGIEGLNGRDCIAAAVTPRHKAPNMIDGTIWIDAKNYSLVKILGVASKSPSAFAGTTQMMREYVQIDGFPMATHARAESSSLFFGRTVVTIDYSDYHLKIKPPQ